MWGRLGQGIGKGLGEEGKAQGQGCMEPEERGERESTGSTGLAQLVDFCWCKSQLVPN